MDAFSRLAHATTRPDPPAALPADPLSPRSGAAALAPDPIETPADRRAMAVIEAEYPHGGYYGSRRTLARAIVAMSEAEVRTDFERRVRAAYAGRLLETVPSAIPADTAVDLVARQLAIELPGWPLHTYRSRVMEMLSAVREQGSGALSPHQARLFTHYQKAVSELNTKETRS
jgi:hypothetical protein